MHGDTLTILLCIVLGFTTWQGLHRPAVMQRYLLSTEAIRLRRDWFRLISPAFLHGSWGHFAGNVITLYLFGSILENAAGPGVMLGIFFVSVAGGSGLCMLLHKSSDYRAIGASGGVLGLVFSVIFLNPGLSIFLFLIPIPIPAWLYAMGYLLYTLYGLKEGFGNVSHEGHMGGLLTGVTVSFLRSPSVVLQQPLLLSLVLGLGIIGIWYFHFNPARVPGFFRMRWRDMLQARKSKRHSETETTLNALLDKVSREGIHSLSSRERAQLEKASKARGRRS